jgi:hypothetical protein
VSSRTRLILAPQPSPLQPLRAHSAVSGTKKSLSSLAVIKASSLGVPVMIVVGVVQTVAVGISGGSTVRDYRASSTRMVALTAAETAVVVAVLRSSTVTVCCVLSSLYVSVDGVTVCHGNCNNIAVRVTSTMLQAS